MVLDSDGKPIEKATIASSKYKKTQTTTDGKFETDTSDSAVVIRKAGFESERLLTKNADTVRVTLRPAGRPRLPACSRDIDYVGLEDAVTDFRFPRLAGISYGDQGHDVDYTTRIYYVTGGSKAKGIMHGTGAMWSVGIPFDRDVQQSAEYRETVYPFRGFGGHLMIIDARGLSPDGTRWRFLGTVGETAEYHGLDDATAQILDKVLDGVCLR